MSSSSPVAWPGSPDDLPIRIAADGGREIWTGSIPPVLFPGSFHPLHDAHRRLWELAADMLQSPVSFEISVVNVDKPALESDEVERRLKAFVGWADAWITGAPRFFEKARWFPGAWFVVGADTAKRLLSPAYHASPEVHFEALRFLREQGCRFLVAARADHLGKCWELDDLEPPAEYREMFRGIPSKSFRLDLSSTALRTRTTP